MNYYVLSFDESTGPDATEIHYFVKYNSHIINWWHFIKNFYILKSDLGTLQLAKVIRSEFPEKNFLLLKTSLKSRDGWLPRKAWDWLRDQVGPNEE